MKKSSITLSLALLSLASQAQTYVEFGYAAVSVDTSNSSVGNPRALRGLIGFELNQNIAIEGLYGVGIGKSNYNIDNMYGFYVTPKLKIAEKVEGFVRAGYTHAAGSYKNTNYTKTYGDFSYGGGFRVALDKNISINFDYMKYLDKSTVTANGFTVGLGLKF